MICKQCWEGCGVYMVGDLSPERTLLTMVLVLRVAASCVWPSGLWGEARWWCLRLRRSKGKTCFFHQNDGRCDGLEACCRVTPLRDDDVICYNVLQCVKLWWHRCWINLLFIQHFCSLWDIRGDAFSAFRNKLTAKWQRSRASGWIEKQRNLVHKSASVANLLDSTFPETVCFAYEVGNF